MNTQKIITILKDLEAKQRNAAQSTFFGQQEYTEYAQALHEAIDRLEANYEH